MHAVYVREIIHSKKWSGTVNPLCYMCLTKRKSILLPNLSRFECSSDPWWARYHPLHIAVSGIVALGILRTVRHGNIPEHAVCRGIVASPAHHCSAKYSPFILQSVSELAVHRPQSPEWASLRRRFSSPGISTAAPIVDDRYEWLGQARFPINCSW